MHFMHLSLPFAILLICWPLSARTQVPTQPQGSEEPRFTAPRTEDDPAIAPLLKEAKAAAEAGSTAQELLANARFTPLHEVTAFRGLVRAAARPATLRLTRADEPGKPIELVGTVVDRKGKPVADALVYAYHTSSKGWYSDRAPHFSGNPNDVAHARLFGYVRTDADGRFTLQTIRPGGYPRSTLPEHIHVHIGSGDKDWRVTEIVFEDDPRLVGEARDNARKNGFVVAKPEARSDGVTVFEPVLTVDVPEGEKSGSKR